MESEPEQTPELQEPMPDLDQGNLFRFFYFFLIRILIQGG